jgi:EmrB/QacA subfamily drug resistance transporter
LKPGETTGGVDKGVVLFVASMASFLTPFMGSSVNIALPSIAKEFNVDAVTLGWITGVYFLAAAMFLVPLGRVADITGRRRIFLLGMMGYTAVSALCVFAASEGMLLALRAAQGLTDAMMFGTSLAIVTSVYPPEQRGWALGITVASVYSGGALGPFLGGLLTQLWGWRSIFVLTAFLGLVVVALTLWKMRGEWAEARGQKMDYLGSLLLGVGLLGIMGGFRLLPSIQGLLLVIGGAAFVAGFLWRESAIDYPVLNLGLFRNTTFAMSNLAALINYSATFAVSFLMSLYLQDVKGLPAETAGILMLCQPVVMAISTLIAGRLSDKVEPRLLSSAGMALTVAALVLFSSLGSGSPLPEVAGILVLSGLGFGLFSSPNTSAIMGSVEKRFYAVASATTGEMRLIGQMLSIGIASLVIAVVMGQVEITPDRYPAFLQAFRLGMLVFAALCAVGIVASMARGTLHAAAGPSAAGPPAAGRSGPDAG